MKQENKLIKLSSFSYFGKNTLSQYVEVSQNSLYSNIKRWLKKGILVQLKRGFYVTGDYLSKNAGSPGYYEFVSNKLYEPSYLSSEYVLQQYNMLSEAVFAFTAITLKTKRKYENQLGRFIYHNVKENLFTGYEIVKKGPFRIKMATRAKALFDYLYLKFYKTGSIDTETIKSLRLNLDDFSKKDLKEFSTYCEMANVAKFKEWPKELRKFLW